MGEQTGPLLHGPGGLASDTAMRWVRDGVPSGLLVDVSRPVPCAEAGLLYGRGTGGLACCGVAYSRAARRAGHGE